MDLTLKNDRRARPVKEIKKISNTRKLLLFRKVFNQFANDQILPGNGFENYKIYEFIEFFPQKCFPPLAQEIVNFRRLADTDKSKTVIALANNLTGNSLYSASLLNKEKHRNITYHLEDTVNKAINDPRFIQ